MEKMISQLRQADFVKLAQYIKGLSYGDLNKLSSRFSDLVGNLTDNGLVGTNDYTKAICVQIEIANAMEEMENGNK
jgi:hypothetical protein